MNNSAKVFRAPWEKFSRERPARSGRSIADEVLLTKRYESLRRTDFRNGKLFPIENIFYIASISIMFIITLPALYIILLLLILSILLPKKDFIQICKKYEGRNRKYKTIKIIIFNFAKLY